MQSFSVLQAAEREGVSHVEWPACWPELERTLLADFFDFAAERAGAAWLHWGMRGPFFGFVVLEQRARRHGLEPCAIPAARRFDLAHYLKRRYGREYAPHPRFWHAAHRNRVAAPGLMNEVEAAAAWDAGRHAALLRSLLLKVNAIAHLYEIVRIGAFRTGEADDKSVGPPPPRCLPEEGPDGVVRAVGVRESSPSVAKVVEALRKAGRKGKPLRAALVEFMADRDSASITEVAHAVHGDGAASCKRVLANVYRTNEDLDAMAAAFRFKASAGYIFKEPVGASGDVLPINSQYVA